MAAGAVFDAAGIAVRLAVRPAGGHFAALVQLVEEDVAALLFLDAVVYPELVLRHELVHVIVAAGGEINVEDAADEPLSGPRR